MAYSSFLDNYQQQVKAGLWIKKGVDPISHCALGLTGEAGEVADLIKKDQYEPAKTYSDLALAQELGDVFWYGTNLATLIGYPIEKIFRMNILKLQQRHAAKEVYDINKL